MWDPSFIEMDDACYILSDIQASSISIYLSISATANLVFHADSITEQQHNQIYILEFADIIQNGNELVNGVWCLFNG